MSPGSFFAATCGMCAVAIGISSSHPASASCRCVSPKREKNMPHQPSSKEIEFRGRVGRIRNHMRAKKLDALFVMQPTNVWYVTGFWEYVPIRIEAALVPLDGSCVFIVSKNEYEYALRTSWIKDIRYYTE